jgi:hypothetical protein
LWGANELGVSISDPMTAQWSPLIDRPIEFAKRSSAVYPFR